MRSSAFNVVLAKRMVSGTSDRCPGVLHIVSARDGGLARIRIPGGFISAEALGTVGALAAQWGDGFLDITARANVQIRGIAPEHQTAFVRDLEQAGLLPAPGHDRVRNIICSPFAGIDPTELVDVRPLLRALDQAIIAAEWCRNLSAKFSFGLDGGGFALDLRHAHIGLRAFQSTDGIAFQLLLSGKSTGYAIPQCSPIVERVLAVAQDLLQAPQPMLQAECMKEWQRCDMPPERPLVTTVLPGQYPAKEPTSLHLVPLIPLGRLTAKQTIGLAQLSTRFGVELRLAPWPGLVLGSVNQGDVAAVMEQLEGLGLSCRADDGFVGVHSCAGLACPAAQDDVRAQAAAVALRLDGLAKKNSWRVNIAGCAKRCAMRGPEALTLIADPQGYTIAEGDSVLGRYAAVDILDQVAERYFAHHEAQS